VYDDDALKQGIESCKTFVELYRGHLVKSKDYEDLVGEKFCTPKIHSLETHVPDLYGSYFKYGGVPCS